MHFMRAFSKPCVIFCRVLSSLWPQVWHSITDMGEDADFVLIVWGQRELQQARAVLLVAS